MPGGGEGGVNGLKSFGVNGRDFGSRFTFAVKAMIALVCVHSLFNRLSAYSTNSPRVKESGETPRIPAH